MSKKKFKKQATVEAKVEHSIENQPPQIQWQNVDHFWNSCVKNGSQVLLDSFKAHLAALGWLNKPEKYLEGAMHFGIEVEK